MFFKIYHRYIIKKYLLTFLQFLIVFSSLIFILNVFEEINFIKDKNLNFHYSIILTLLNLPSMLYELSPFIFLLSSQFFFIKILENDELDAFKKFGLSNTKILSTVSITTFFIGILVVSLFYNFSAELKYIYYDLKNKISEENKYLAAITENGIWLRDENKININFVNAKKLNENYIEDISITVFNKNFELLKNIEAEKADISNFTWKIYNVKIFESNQPKKDEDYILFKTNFDYNRLNSLFSNLFSVSIWNLFSFQNDPNLINFSSKQITLHLNQIYSYPIFICLMTLVSAVLMLNLDRNKNKFFYIFLGVFLSVCIYFFRYMFTFLGDTKDLSPLISIWLPILFITIITFFGLVKINEK